MKPLAYDLNIEDWTRWIGISGPTKILRQTVMDWLYQKRGASFDAMSNVSFMIGTLLTIRIPH